MRNIFLINGTCSLILLLLCYVYCLHICQLCLAKLNTVYNAVVIFAGPKRAQTTQTCCGAEFWLMFTNFFWSTDTDIMHPALSNMSCSIVEPVDWVNNVIEILGPSLIIVYARRNVICLGNVWWPRRIIRRSQLTSAENWSLGFKLIREKYWARIIQ